MLCFSLFFPFLFFWFFFFYNRTGMEYSFFFLDFFFVVSSSSCFFAIVFFSCLLQYWRHCALACLFLLFENLISFLCVLFSPFHSFTSFHALYRNKNPIPNMEWVGINPECEFHFYSSAKQPDRHSFDAYFSYSLLLPFKLNHKMQTIRFGHLETMSSMQMHEYILTFLPERLCCFFQFKINLS